MHRAEPHVVRRGVAQGLGRGLQRSDLPSRRGGGSGAAGMSPGVNFNGAQFNGAPFSGALYIMVYYIRHFLTLDRVNNTLFDIFLNSASAPDFGPRQVGLGNPPPLGRSPVPVSGRFAPTAGFAGPLGGSVTESARAQSYILF